MLSASLGCHVKENIVGNQFLSVLDGCLALTVCKILDTHSLYSQQLGMFCVLPKDALFASLGNPVNLLGLNCHFCHYFFHESMSRKHSCRSKFQIYLDRHLWLWFHLIKLGQLKLKKGDSFIHIFSQKFLKHRTHCQSFCHTPTAV